MKHTIAVDVGERRAKLRDQSPHERLRLRELHVVTLLAQRAALAQLHLHVPGSRRALRARNGQLQAVSSYLRMSRGVRPLAVSLHSSPPAHMICASCQAR